MNQTQPTASRCGKSDGDAMGACVKSSSDGQSFRKDHNEIMSFACNHPIIPVVLTTKHGTYLSILPSNRTQTMYNRVPNWNFLHDVPMLKHETINVVNLQQRTHIL